MSLYKLEDVIAETRSYSREDILRMPIYEFLLKLDIMKERAEEREKREKAESEKQSKLTNPSKYKLPSAPKMPTKFR